MPDESRVCCISLIRTVTVSPETAEILRTAVQISELSGGVFDVTIAPASTLWDFTSGEQKIPAENALASAAEKIDWRKLRVDGNDVTLPAGMMIDLETPFPRMPGLWNVLP